MSLIHWWSLNGNIKDYGTNNLNGSLLSGASFSSAGKIGQCLIADDGNYTGRGVSIPSNLVDELSNTDYSFCAWIKVNGNHRAYEGAIISSGNWNNSCWAFGLNQDNTAINPAGNWYANDYVSYTFEVGKWYHIVSVQKSGTNYVYVNGSLVGSISHSPISQSDASDTCIGRETYAGGYFGFNGEINDVRVYNHALSQKEVKEISKGLVLHYTFEDAYAEGTTNLIDQSNPITAVVRCSTYGNGVKIDWTDPNNQGDTYFMFNTPNMTEGVTYTLSFDCEGLLPDSDTVWAVSNTYSPTKLHNGRNVFIFTANGTENRLFFDDWSRDDRLDNLTMTNFQLEQKDHATPYVNGTRQPGIISDSSGYGYNGTQNNCAITTDSRCGQYSLSTNDAYGYVQLPSIYLDTQFTISTWVKHLDSFSAWARIFDLGNAASGADYDIGFATSDSSGSMYVFGRTGSGGSLPDSYCGVMDFDWHLWSLVVDGTNIKLYKDGEVIKEFTAYANVGGVLYTLNYLNKSNWSGDGYSKKYYSDFKIYNTALSASDILAEYQRKAAIDRNGNLFTGEIVETSNNLMDKIAYHIANATGFRTWAYLSHCTENDYNTYYPNDTDIGLSAYVQDNCQVTQTFDGIRIYSSANASSDNTWGGLAISPMMSSKCLIKGHRYVISWHVKGHSSRAMTDVYWTNQVGWGQYPDAEPTVNKYVLPPANFNGEMDCMYDFTITDDIFKMTTSDVHSGFDPNTSYLAYAAFKIGFTYQETGELGTDIYITNLQMIDVTDGRIYKITKQGIVETTRLISGVNNKARVHSSGMLDVTNIKEL